MSVTVRGVLLAIPPHEPPDLAVRAATTDRAATILANNRPSSCRRRSSPSQPKEPMHVFDYVRIRSGEGASFRPARWSLVVGLAFGPGAIRILAQGRTRSARPQAFQL